MKTYKKYSTAKKYADGKPIIRIGHDLYIIGFNAMTEIALIDSNGIIGNYITVKKFSELGNGNYATPNHNWRA